MRLWPVFIVVIQISSQEHIQNGVLYLELRLQMDIKSILKIRLLNYLTSQD